MIPLDCLVNGVTVCEILNVSKSYVSTLIRRPETGFPKPLDTPGVAGFPLWDVREIVAWRDDPSRRRIRDTRVNREFVNRYNRNNEETGASS
jgi:hypothetical protein